MVLWAVLPSVLLLSSITPKATINPLNEVQRVVKQLLGVSHLRVEVAHDTQSVDRVRIGAVSLLLRDKVQEFTRSSDGLSSI